MKNNNGILWVKKGAMGNWIVEWILLIEFDGTQWEFFRIIQFVKVEYSLPQGLFPRDGFYNRQKTRHFNQLNINAKWLFPGLPN